MALGVGPAEAKRDKRDKAFAEEVEVITEAMTAAAQGLELERRWTLGGTHRGLGATDQETLDEFAAWLGDEDFEVVMSVVELRAVTTERFGGGKMRGQAMVLPRGRVRWLAPSVRGDGPFSRPGGDIEAASPGMAAGVELWLEGLQDPECSLRLIEERVVAKLPEDVGRELYRNPDQLASACRSVQSHRTPWYPELRRVTVLIRSGDKWATLFTFVDVEGGRLELERLRFREME